MFQHNDDIIFLFFLNFGKNILMILWQIKFPPPSKQRQAKLCGFIFTVTVNSPYVTLHAKRGLMDFTKNREFFSRSRCVN